MPHKEWSRRRAISNFPTMSTLLFPPSELIINTDGSIFHLHLHPEQLADRIILVGDPARVAMVASFFETQECCVHHREFHSITGSYRGKRITVLSTGIGCDNIDIVLNELDALANINFQTRTLHPSHRPLEIVRIGTCGGLQSYTPEGSYILSQTSIGLDGLLNFYAHRNDICDLALETAFLHAMQWKAEQCMAHPYCIDADPILSQRIAGNDMVRGITVSCGGFYAPQGRRLRLPLADENVLQKIMHFAYNGMHITNFEMESSAVAGLAQLMGHRATTCCLVIANRQATRANTDYHAAMTTLIQIVLERI